jgi:tetratricopeptide (TPR) repeat protein
MISNAGIGFHRLHRGTRQYFAACLLALAGTSLASDHPEPAHEPEHHDKAHPPASAVVSTNATPRASDLEQSLSSRFEPAPPLPAELTTSENILLKKMDPVVTDQLRPWQAQIESAVKYRADKNNVLAENTLVGILQSADAPPSILRECLKHLAQWAVEARQYSRAQQIYSQFVTRFPVDPETPEILFRQGLLYRQMGANEMALAKFYAVMSTTISLQEEYLSRYKSLVLLAQTEIADTFYLQAQYREAADFFRKILKLEQPEVNEPVIRYKLVKSLVESNQPNEAVAEGQVFVSKCQSASQLPEVRFLLAESYKKLGRRREALEQTLALLTAEKSRSEKDPETWAYWQQRTGNDLGNELYRQGDYLNSLQVYDTLSRLQDSPEWKLPALYQTGLVYERLNQPPKAIEVYDQIVTRAKDLTNASPNLKLIVDMARWRKDQINWNDSTSKEAQDIVTGKDSGAEPSNLSSIRRKK